MTGHPNQRAMVTGANHRGYAGSSLPAVCPNPASRSAHCRTAALNVRCLVMPAGLTETAMRSDDGSVTSNETPAITSSMRAASATVVASGPFSAIPP